MTRPAPGVPGPASRFLREARGGRPGNPRAPRAAERRLEETEADGGRGGLVPDGLRDADRSQRQRPTLRPGEEARWSRHGRPEPRARGEAPRGDGDGRRAERSCRTACASPTARSGSGCLEARDARTAGSRLGRGTRTDPTRPSSSSLGVGEAPRGTAGIGDGRGERSDGLRDPETRDRHGSLDCSARTGPAHPLELDAGRRPCRGAGTRLADPGGALRCTGNNCELE